MCVCVCVCAVLIAFCFHFLCLDQHQSFNLLSVQCSNSVCALKVHGLLEFQSSSSSSCPSLCCGDPLTSIPPPFMNMLSARCTVRLTVHLPHKKEHKTDEGKVPDEICLSQSTGRSALLPIQRERCA